MRSLMASAIGTAQGANLSSMEPGKKPSERPQGTLGRVRMILSILPLRRRSAAWVAAIQVLPVPAGPKTTICSDERRARDIATGWD